MGGYHESGDIVTLIVEGEVFPSVGGFAVGVDVDEEEVCVWEGGFEICDLVCPHCGGHVCCVKKDDCLLRDVDWCRGRIE
jgi:hypothetical protein